MHGTKNIKFQKKNNLYTYNEEVDRGQNEERKKYSVRPGYECKN
jgi:hypothetical protein